MSKMKLTKKILVIIPVRGNSKRLRNKNILPIKNLPMFLYVIQNIKKSKSIQESNKPAVAAAPASDVHPTEPDVGT